VLVPEFRYCFDFHLLLDCILGLFVKKKCPFSWGISAMAKSFDLALEFYFFSPLDRVTNWKVSDC